jgi:hypothetical protein
MIESAGPAALGSGLGMVRHGPLEPFIGPDPEPRFNVDNSRYVKYCALDEAIHLLPDRHQMSCGRI